jgi:type IV pilus assembly protein PilC
MLFNYKAITNTNEDKFGTIEAATKDSAILALQRRGLILSSIKEGDLKKSIFDISFGGGNVPMKDIVIMSRQISTLFESQVSALKAFNLIATNTENKTLVKVLGEVSEEIKSGTTISSSLAKHPKVFSDFYVNMVKAGEESGKLTQTFSYLADYLDRQYQLTGKTKNALTYPAFVIGVFFLIMVLMFTFIIPKLGAMITESGQEIPLMTSIIMKISDIFVNYWIFLIVGVAIAIVVIGKLMSTPAGKMYFDRLKISLPVFKNIFNKLYLSRIADNMDTMLSSGIPIVRSIELTAAVVGNKVYEDILRDVAERVKAGSSLSDAFAKHSEIPQIMSGMIKVGEETGSVGSILKTLGNFYGREVNEAVNTMVGLIEPIMIVAMGLGVGVLLSAILMPIYNIAGGIE